MSERYTDQGMGGNPEQEKEVLVFLQLFILAKKYGEDFMSDYDDLKLRASHGEDDEGMVRPVATMSLKERMEFVEKSVFGPGVIKEIDTFEDELIHCDTVEAMLVVAQKHGVEVTDKELEEVRRKAANREV